MIGSAKDFITNTRASKAWAQNLSGEWIEFAAGEPRIIEGRGILSEESSTNHIRNNSMLGASIPSTFPTNWSWVSLNDGISFTVVGTGIEDGIDYIDINISGTSVGGSATRQIFDNTTGITASSGETWTSSAFVRLINGELNDSTLQIEFRGFQSGGSSNADLFGQSFIPDNSQLSIQRYSVTNILVQASTAFIRPTFRFGFSIGKSYNYTIRIGWPQLELKSFATSPIRTIGSAATRNSDITITNDFSWYNQFEGTFYVEGGPDRLSGTQINVLVGVDDDSSNNRIQLRKNQPDTAAFQAVVDGVQQLSVGVSGWSSNTIHKLAGAYANNDAIMASNGILSTQDTSGTLPTVTSARIAYGGNANSRLNGWLKGFTYYQKRLSDEKLQELTS